MIQTSYNPDVLSCLANLSNDEVFTPPSLVNDILDLLPNDLWNNPDAKFLDPVSKSGVFLREIAKRLDKGLESKISNKQERINHIFNTQLYGISITELTSLLSRRSVYGSKIANGKYSFCDNFKDEQGNIRYERLSHTWQNGKCIFCSASQEVYDREDELETYAYNFIHTNNPEKIFNMKFDVIVGNPPYQLSDGGAGASAMPIYNKFIEQSIKLNPKYLSMIIPSRWFAGGKGLDEFRVKMLNDNRIKYLNDFVNAKECFPGVSLGGGVCYFLWDREHKGNCKIVNTMNQNVTISERALNEFDVFIRNNDAIEIIKKIKSKNNQNISDYVESRNPFGFSSSARGEETSKKGNIKLHSSKGIGYVSISSVEQGLKHISKYKVMISKVTSEHAGEPDKNGKFRVLSTCKILEPNNICTDSYLIVGTFENSIQANNFRSYLTTKFSRFLLLQAVTSINLSKDKFVFIPKMDNNIKWTDDDLYKHFELKEEEIEVIENLMKKYETDTI
jgi:site-specific DNA-methyltransferase (adenine-specific)